jgi:DNA-binding transcriptional MerR regulator
MAKEQFQRTKPHVNVATTARQRLRQAGMSLAGIDQLLKGRPLTQSEDRELVARIVVQAANRAGYEVHGFINTDSP